MVKWLVLKLSIQSASYFYDNFINKILAYERPTKSVYFILFPLN